MTRQHADRRRASVPRFVGRETELATLARALAEPPAVAAVEGEAGIGKTRLVAELRHHPALAGQRLLRGNCRRIREPFPLGPLVEALRGMADDLATARLSAVAGALRPLLPELNAVLPPVPEPLDDRAAERHRVFRAMAEVLACAGPALLVIEDGHWADEHTLDFLGYLLGDPPPTLSLLLTFRTEDADPAVRAMTANPPPGVARAQVTLAPFDRTRTGQLAAAILGQDNVSEEFADYLCERAAGVPFIIEELLALMQARGLLARRDGGWFRRAIDQLDVPAGVRDPVLERLSRLRGDARTVIEAAAVLHVPTPAPVLLAVSRLPSDRGRAGLAAALESGLLSEQDGATGFRHALAAQAVYGAMVGPRRQLLHARAAEALRTVDPVPLGQRAHHLRSAGQVAEWVAAAEQAADQALALGHDEEAARLLEDVLAAPLPPPQRGRLAVKLARAAHQMLHFDKDVVGLLAGVADADLPPATRGELRLRLALLLERAGEDIPRQRELLEASVVDLEDRPELQAHAMAGLGIPCQPGIPLAEHMRWLDRVLETVPAVADHALQVSLLGKVAMVQVAVGDPRWRDLADRILVMTGGAPHHPAEVTAYHSIGANACYAGHLTDAARLLVAVRNADRHDAGRWRELSARATLVLLDYCRGAWEGLADRADELADQLADHAPGRADVEVVAGCLALARGELGPATRRPAEVAQKLAGRGAYDVLPLIVAAAIRSAAGHGEVVEAESQARRFLAAVESVPLVVSAAWALPALTEALVRSGAGDDARALVTRWARKLRGPGAPLAAAALPHARGALMAAAGQWSTAAADFLAAADHYDRLGCVYEAALAREKAGSALLRAGDRAAGTTHLHAAVTAFQEIGAGWDLDRSSRTARSYRVRVPGRHRGGRRGYGEELSPRECEVAKLAAYGRRNKEIAAALYLSTSTVNKHLTAAMRKLDVTSRTALARRLIIEQRDRSDRH